MLESVVELGRAGQTGTLVDGPKRKQIVESGKRGLADAGLPIREEVVWHLGRLGV